MNTTMPFNQREEEIELINEFRLIPSQHRKSFMKIVKAYRESVGFSNQVDKFEPGLSELEQDFKESWAQAQKDEVYPIKKFWEMLNAE